MTVTSTDWHKHKAATRVALLLGATLLIAGCDENGQFSLGAPQGQTETDSAEATPSRRTKLVERDVESPEVFQVTEAGLWDGRPSLGGVWVAHPDVKDPERVIIRNTDNGKFVIGALFRRERATPGPKLQLSSDAAEALGMLAGQPRPLNVTALRREEVPADPVEAPGGALDGPAEVSEKALDPIASSAATAIASAETDAATGAASAAPAPKPAAAPAAKPAPKKSGLAKPYLQIGIFSVETNANNTATKMRLAGMVPTVKKQTSKGKTFWRVLIGPATSSTERATLLRKIKAEGFSDAYAVTN